MTAVSCSDGTNGLITRYGYQTQGAIPHFPHVGGAAQIAGWNSASVSFYQYACLPILRLRTGKLT